MRADVLIITAADGEDRGVRAVTNGAIDDWRQLTADEKPAGFHFELWTRAYRRTARPDDDIRLLHCHTFQMGTDVAGQFAALVATHYRPRCLAMCGVCAGRPGWTSLGDVVIAERGYRYDTGGLTNDTPGGVARFDADITTYQPPAAWLASAKAECASADHEPSSPTWLARDPAWFQPPVPLEHQRMWLLNELCYGDLGASTDRSVRCPDWGRVLPSLEKDELITIRGASIEATPKGRERIDRERLLTHGVLAAPPQWRIHVAPMGTGSSVVKDVDIWQKLAINQRRVRAFDMEASVIGLSAWMHGISTMLVVKGVMDNGDPAKGDTVRRFAARAAAEVLIGFLRQHLEPSGSPLIDLSAWRPSAGEAIPGLEGWTLLKRLRPGGFGEVWLAENAKRGRLQHVFKFCFDEHKAKALARELGIADALPRLECFARVENVHLESPPFYFSTPFAPDGALDEWTERSAADGGPGGLPNVPEAERLRIFALIAEAVSVADAAGVVHRDIKPQNILILRHDDQPPRVQLSDFGLARITDPAVREKLNRQGSPVTTLAGMTQEQFRSAGTLMYMSPRRLAGREGGRANAEDVYALGVLLYQLAIGNFTAQWPPYPGLRVQDELLWEDVLAATQPEESKRMITAAELAQRVRSIEGRRKTARSERDRRDRAAEEAKKARARSKLLLVSFAVLLTVGTAVGSLVWSRYRAISIRSTTEDLIQQIITWDNLQGHSPIDLERVAGLQSLKLQAHSVGYLDGVRLLDAKLDRAAKISDRVEWLPPDEDRIAIVSDPTGAIVLVGYKGRIDALDVTDVYRPRLVQTISLQRFEIDKPVTPFGDSTGSTQSSPASRGPATLLQLRTDPRAGILAEVKYESEDEGVECGESCEMFALTPGRPYSVGTTLSCKWVEAVEGHGYGGFEMVDETKAVEAELSYFPGEIPDTLNGFAIPKEDANVKILAKDPGGPYFLVVETWTSLLATSLTFDVVSDHLSDKEENLPYNFSLLALAKPNGEWRVLGRWYDSVEPRKKHFSYGLPRGADGYRFGLPTLTPSALSVRAAHAFVFDHVYSLEPEEDTKPSLALADAIQSVGGRVTSARWLADGSALILGGNRSVVVCTPDGQAVRRKFVAPPQARAIEVSPDGKTVLVMMRDGRVHAWNMEALELDWWE